MHFPGFRTVYGKHDFLCVCTDKSSGDGYAGIVVRGDGDFLSHLQARGVVGTQTRISGGRITCHGDGLLGCHVEFLAMTDGGDAVHPVADTLGQVQLRINRLGAAIRPEQPQRVVTCQVSRA